MSFNSENSQEEHINSLFEIYFSENKALLIEIEDIEAECFSSPENDDLKT